MIGKKQSKTLGTLLLALLAAYFLCISLFTHSHNINGFIVTHSHPFSQAPDTGNHTHTTAEFIAIAQLSALLMLLVSWYPLMHLSSRGYERPSEFNAVWVYKADLHSVPHRGPPAVC